MPARFTCFLVKIASRCNLACDYCYVYEHADQSWRQQPRVMSPENREQLANRLAEYVEHAALGEIVVVFHGGEPLLAGADTIAETAKLIRSTVRPSTDVGFTMQTNGVLLDEPALDTLWEAGVSVSLSIDGPQTANDRHRLTIRGRSSFGQTARALELLKTRPDQFAGVIAVIDADVPGASLLEFFDEHRPPQVDFLLPDANHLCPPPGREANAARYAEWLIAAFDAWFDRYPHLRVRTFDQLLQSIAGLPSGTDAFGLGNVSLLSIETDGSYHDLDVLKITQNGGTALGFELRTSPIASAAGSPRIETHRALLTVGGLAAECRACPEVDICGGGSVPHRFASDGFDHPTVYCIEMLALIGHARRRLAVQLDIEREHLQSRTPRLGLECDYDRAEVAVASVAELVEDWIVHAAVDLQDALKSAPGVNPATLAVLETEDADRGQLAIAPSVLLWTRVALDAQRGVVTRSLDGSVLRAETSLPDRLGAIAATRSTHEWLVHEDEPWLRRPFGSPIVFENDPGLIHDGRALVRKAMDLIAAHSPALLSEIRLLSREIQFVRDLDADPDKCVSFSDDILPGALFVSLRAGNGLIGVEDLADSIIHEHRHQKLYLLQRASPLVERDFPLVASPWRLDPRPPSGLLHAAFVFVELRRFWSFVRAQGVAESTSRAEAEIASTDAKLLTAWQTLHEVALTPAGQRIVDDLERAHRQP